MLRVKEICEERGLTMQDLAKALNITYQSLWSQLSGNPTLSKLQAIDAALNVEIVDLFERRGDFVAFVRDQGKIYTFDTIKALKEFTDAAHEAAENMRQFGEVADAEINNNQK